MKTKAEQIAFLREHSSETPSKWSRKNIGWISYSRNIAIKVAMAMNEQNLTQRQLAERMNCSPQYVSRLLKGEENLSLETICKLEVALNICILSNAFAK